MGRMKWNYPINPMVHTKITVLPMVLYLCLKLCVHLSFLFIYGEWDIEGNSINPVDELKQRQCRLSMFALMPPYLSQFKRYFAMMHFLLFLSVEIYFMMVYFARFKQHGRLRSNHHDEITNETHMVVSQPILNRISQTKTISYFTGTFVFHPISFARAYRSQII